MGQLTLYESKNADFCMLGGEPLNHFTLVRKFCDLIISG